MPIIVMNLSVLAIAVIYYAYRDLYLAKLRKEQQLRERVAYMLWCAADHAE